MHSCTECAAPLRDRRARRCDTCRPLYKRAYAARWRRENYHRTREVERAQVRARYRRRSDIVKAQARKWREENPDKVRKSTEAWRRAHPDRVVAFHQNRRTRLANAPGDGVSSAEWAERFRLFGGFCAYCDQPAEHMDHVIPLFLGGSHDIFNVVPACASCNASKGTRDPLVWAGVRSEKP